MAGKARVLVSLTDETYAALVRAAKGSGKTLGGLAGEILEEARPILIGLAGVFEQAKSHRLDAFEDLQKLLTATVTDGQQVAAEMGEFHRSAKKLDATVATMAKKRAHRAKST